jgi:hypothetical protein
MHKFTRLFAPEPFNDCHKGDTRDEAIDRINEAGESMVEVVVEPFIEEKRRGIRKGRPFCIGLARRHYKTIL